MCAAWAWLGLTRRSSSKVDRFVYALSLMLSLLHAAIYLILFILADRVNWNEIAAGTLVLVWIGVLTLFAELTKEEPAKNKPPTKRSKDSNS